MHFLKYFGIHEELFSQHLHWTEYGQIINDICRSLYIYSFSKVMVHLGGETIIICYIV